MGLAAGLVAVAVVRSVGGASVVVVEDWTGYPMAARRHPAWMGRMTSAGVALPRELPLPSWRMVASRCSV